jgi:hypothetical protein
VDFDFERDSGALLQIVLVFWAKMVRWDEDVIKKGMSTRNENGQETLPAAFSR